MKKRLLAYLMSLCLILTLLPVSAFAEDTPISIRSEDEAAPETTMTYTYDEGTNTLTITGNGVIGEEIKQQKGYTTWKQDVTTIKISGDITGIADQENFYGLFQLWEKLETVEYTGNTNFQVGNYAFSECYKLKSFPFDHVSAVGEGAFKRAAFTEVKLSNLSGDIGDFAFYGNESLASVTVSAGAADTYIGTQAFALLSKGNALQKVKISGEGTLRIGNSGLNAGKTFSWQLSLETVDLSGFSGSVSLGDLVFLSDSSLKNISLGENTTISHVGYACFSGCTALAQDFLDFAKLTGSVARAAFSISTKPDQGALTGLKELDLSNVTEIGAFAMAAERKYEDYGYTDLTSVTLDRLERLHAYAFQGASNINWDNANIPEAAKLAYSDVLVSGDTIWQRVLNIMDGKFTLDSDGYSTPLAPSDNGWEDSKSGEENGVEYDTTQLTKAAKWTNTDKTKAEVELRFAYAPKEQMDFVFVLDTSTSMADWYDLESQDDDLEIPVEQETKAQYAKMYEMQSKVADITEKLLSSEQLDSRVAVVAFGNDINFYSQGSEQLSTMLTNAGESFNSLPSSAGFYTANDLDTAIGNIRNIPCKGSTYYYTGLWYASYYVWAAAAAERDVTVVFLSDGEAMDGGDSDFEYYLNYYSNYIKNPDPNVGYGKNIFGVMYKEVPTENDKKYIKMACSEDKVYLASDTEEFSDAINRAIYTALNSFTLTDQIGEDFEAVTRENISVDGGTVLLDQDGRIITWSFDEPVPYKTYTMTIQLDLKQTEGGEYPAGSFATNKGDALLNDRDSEKPVNKVASPALSRTDAPETYTVIYTDGVEGEEVFANQKYEGLLSGADTPAFQGTPSRAGYTFMGWSPAVAATVTGNAIYTATWKKNTSGGGTTWYILHYESNGGTKYKDEIYDKNTVVQLDKVPTREGYQFTGWYADEELTERITSIKMTSDKTVYAGWRVATVPDWLNGNEHIAYVIGYDDGAVRPNANISRAEVATIFFRLLKADVRNNNLTSVNSFDDVMDGVWYNMSVSTMAYLGIVNGRTANIFDPDAAITRAEFAAICARFDTGLTEGNSKFTDISGHWAEEEIKRAVSLGWIRGYEDGTFRPDQYITRAEAMTIINRVLCRIPEDESDLLPDMNVWPDNAPDAWYYLAVQEATNSHDYRHKGEVYETWTDMNADPDWTRYQ